MFLTTLSVTKSSLWVIYESECRKMTSSQKQIALGKYAKYQYKLVKRTGELDNMLTVPPLDEDEAFQIEIEYSKQWDKIFHRYKRKLINAFRRITEH